MNWDQLIRAIVPLTFLAIWALTSLFNRESKAFPPRNAGPSPPFGPRPGEPPMRWSPPAPPTPRRVAIGDDDILILSPEGSRPARPGPARPAQAGGPRRPTRGKATTPARKPEAAPSRPKLGGVSQNVNQQLASSIGRSTPLSAIAPMATSTGSDLASSPSAPSRTTTPLPTVSTLVVLMNDPSRLREAFLVNELLKPPVALRRSHGHGR